MTDISSASGVTPEELRRRRVLTAAAAGVAVIVALVLWLALRGGDGDKAKTTAVKPPEVVTAAQLKDIASQLGFPLYWAGQLKGAKIEYSQTSNGRYFIRYLTNGAAAGDQRRVFLSIGTYPQDNAYATVVSASKQPTASSATTKSGALLYNDRRVPRSYYFSFPKAKFQVEVYDPSPARAKRLLLSGKIRRVL